MTRILVLSNLYPPHAMGGYEWSCHDVMQRLSARGHEVTVLTTTTRLGDVAEDELCPAIRVHRSLEWYWDDHELLDPPPLKRLMIERRNHRRVRALLDELRPDVVSVWNMGALSLALLRTVAERSIPMVYAVCDEWPVYGPQLDAWCRMFAHRPRLARLCEAIVGIPCRTGDLGSTGAFCFVSAHTRDACVRMSSFRFPCNTVVHSGIDLRDFPVVERRHGDWRGRLLYVGRLDPRKGVLTAVEALAHLPDSYTLEMVGRGDAERAVRRRAQELALSDRIAISSLDRSELAEVYRRADAFLFTSEWEEPFGLTPIEAMACGVPVIGTGTGGSAEFLLDGITCLRYTPGDAEGLARRVQQLAGDESLRARLVDSGQRVASALTTDRLADTFEEWHVSAANGYPDGPPDDHPLWAAVQ